MENVSVKSKGLMSNFLSGFNQKAFINTIIPNASVSQQMKALIVVLWMFGAAMYWNYGASEILPQPGEIWTSFKELVSSGGLLGEMWTSMKLCFTSIAYTVVVSLLICYSTVLPIFRPIGFIFSKFRFLTLVGLSFVFTIIASNFDNSGYALKTMLLTFGMSVFFITSMMGVLNDITSNELNHARTLGMKEWRVVWEVNILSKIDKIFDVIRANFAISWMMLTLVEGMSRADGGIGAMLINQNKHLHLDAVFAIQILILIVGIAMDYMFGVFKKVACPYANLTTESK